VVHVEQDNDGSNNVPPIIRESTPSSKPDCFVEGDDGGEVVACATVPEDTDELDFSALSTAHESSSKATTLPRSDTENTRVSGVDASTSWNLAAMTRKARRMMTSMKTVSLETVREAELKPSGNRNSPQDYVWLESSLRRIMQNEGHSLGCVDTGTGRPFTALFFVIGSCPNFLCGMQGIGYFIAEGKVDFWWVKPCKGDLASIEEATLSRHCKGIHRNEPGRSRQFYKPLADLFERGDELQGWLFGTEEVRSKNGHVTFRAFLQQDSKNGGAGRLYVYLLWQEDWTSSPFASSKYIKGKIVYQKVVPAGQSFSRQFEIHDNKMFISDLEEAPFTDVLPGVEVKRLWKDACLERAR